MDNIATDFTLPPAPRGLCFDRNDFVKTNFSIDSFLAEHQSEASLESMRDDLGVYLKVLRLAMIELINKDYANFVNLSATLIGFDKAIEKIQVPLVQLNEEVLNVKQCLEDAIKELTMWLSQRHTLQKKKCILKYYSHTLNSLKTLEKIFNEISQKSDQDQIIAADRAALQYNELKFSIYHSEVLIKPEHRTLFENISDKLTQTLNTLLIKFFDGNDEYNMLKTLTILASLGRVTETEVLIRKQIITPLLHNIITESTLQKSKDGLEGIYNKILSLLTVELKTILSVTQSPKLAFLSKKYTFLVNCFWCEIESRIEVNLSSIFAPGNPKIFYQRYSESVVFVQKLEQYLQDDETRKLLRQSNKYKSFQRRWNLPVYFQIRFQEIAGLFEGALKTNPTIETAENIFALKETAICWKSLHDCWSPGIYIDALAHKFWKLTLQLIARYITWVNAFCQQKPPKAEVAIYNKNIIDTSILLYLDIKTLSKHIVKLLEVVHEKMPTVNLDVLADSIKPSEEALLEALENIKQLIVSTLFDYFNAHLKQVSDIPRLYRKTNRSVPTKACQYIDVISKSIQEFHRDANQKLDNEFLIRIYEALFSSMTDSYYKYIEDVLTSVHKTEESLRRLKEIREGTPQLSTNSTMSDGEKIRVQLNVDFVAYGAIAESLHIDLNKISKYVDMKVMVKDAVKNINIK